MSVWLALNTDFGEVKLNGTVLGGAREAGGIYSMGRRGGTISAILQYKRARVVKH